MLKNAVKALEKKYSGNGFVAVDNEGALMDARLLTVTRLIDVRILACGRKSLLTNSG